MAQSMAQRPRKVNPILLLGLIITLILSFGILASAELAGIPAKLATGAKPAGGTAGDAIGVGKAQMGKPFVMATDGPNTFSCSGLVRYIMRTIGVDGDAPWVPEGYLGKYRHVDPADLQPGDVVIYPDWATMYVGDGMLLDANEYLGHVTETPMGVAGTPEGIVRPPYRGQPSQDGAAKPPAQPLSNKKTDPLTQPLKTDPLTQPLAPPLSDAIDPLTQPLSDTPDPSTQPLDGEATQPLSDTSDPSPQPLDATQSLSDTPDSSTQPPDDGIDPLTQPLSDTPDLSTQPLDGEATQPLDGGAPTQPLDGEATQPLDGTSMQF
jgi:peptidoglycan DL-endopeptidase CwlO